MNILEALVKLRDDLKIWSTNNFNKKLNKNLSVEEGGKFLTTNADGDIITTSIGATVEELGYVSGATSNIQEQLNGKAPLNHPHYYAGSSSVGGSANSAVKLDSSAGSATQPVYFKDGKPTAIGYTIEKSVPSDAKFTDTNTHYTSKNVVGAKTSTSNTTTTLSNGNVYINSVENGAVTSSHKISGSGATTVTADTSGNIVVSSTSYTHPSYTTRTGVPTANQAPAFGETFNVSQPVSDSTGHITAINSRTITIPKTEATTTKAGLMSAEDKVKLNALEALIPPAPSEGLAYTLSDDGTYYICSGIGTCTATDIVVASEYSGLPVKEIGNKAFYTLSTIQSLVIPDGVTSIDEYALYNCSGLTSVIIPDSMISIGKYAFRGCNNLKNVVIPNGVTSIGISAFNNCDSLTSIVIPDSVTSIGSSAFSYCDSLASAVLPVGMTSIVDSMFSNCKSLTSIEIPVGVTTIENAAFEGCKSLTSIVIPDTVTHIWGRAFKDCYSLTSVVIPDGLTHIAYEAFWNCIKLPNIIIPKSVTNIEKDAFRGCSVLSIYCIGSSIATWVNYNDVSCPIYWNCRDGIEINKRLNNLGLTVGSTEYKIAFGNLDISDAKSGDFTINTGLTTLVAITVTPVVYSAGSSFDGAAPIVIYESDNSPNVRCRYNNSQTDFKYGAVRWIAIGT